MSKNEVWEGEMKAQKKWVVRKAKDEKKIFFSELGSPSFQKILRSEDEEDDDDDVAGRVGDWRNMGNIEPTNVVKFKQLEEYMEGSRRGGNRDTWGTEMEGSVSRRRFVGTLSV
jgi:hypothetical protein